MTKSSRARALPPIKRDVFPDYLSDLETPPSEIQVARDISRSLLPHCLDLPSSYRHHRHHRH